MLRIARGLPEFTCRFAFTRRRPCLVHRIENRGQERAIQTQPSDELTMRIHSGDDGGFAPSLQLGLYRLNCFVRFGMAKVYGLKHVDSSNWLTLIDGSPQSFQ